MIHNNTIFKQNRGLKEIMPTPLLELSGMFGNLICSNFSCTLFQKQIFILLLNINIQIGHKILFTFNKLILFFSISIDINMYININKF